MARKQGSHSDITGPRVREAALRLIARYGFAAVSMRQIAAEIGVQAGTLYNYTSDKQSLLFDLMRTHMDELLRDLQDVPLSVGDPLTRLEVFVRFHIRWHLPRRDGVFLSYMELRNLTRENFVEIAGLRRQYEAVLEGILRDGQACGDFDIRDARLTTMALISLLTGVTNWYRDAGRLDPEEVVEIYVEMAQNTVGVRHLHAAQ